MRIMLAFRTRHVFEATDALQPLCPCSLLYFIAQLVFSKKELIIITNILPMDFWSNGDSSRHKYEVVHEALGSRPLESVLITISKFFL
jgi:hypothetical protein